MNLAQNNSALHSHEFGSHVIQLNATAGCLINMHKQQMAPPKSDCGNNHCIDRPEASWALYHNVIFFKIQKGHTRIIN